MTVFKLVFITIFICGVGVVESRRNTPEPYVFPDISPLADMPKTNNVPTVEGVELGRYLFYSKSLSRDFSISCASCHKQEFAFSGGNLKVNVGIDSILQKRNTMPLFNLAWNTNFFWDGRAATMESQVFEPVRSHKEMDLDWQIAAERISNSSFYKGLFKQAFGNEKIDSVLIAKAIAQFEMILISNNSKYDRVIRGEDSFTKDEFRGFEIVNDQSMGNCLHCHNTDGNALGTNGKLSNNGLDFALNYLGYHDGGQGEITKKESDYGRFKIPSLRNLVLTAPYMHDGRFETLEEVVDFYSTGVHHTYNIDSKMGSTEVMRRNFSEEDKRSVIAFLKTLTDSTFVTNPAFSNPF